MRLARLPIAVPPARHETTTSYLARLAALHGLHPAELWHQVSSPLPGTSRRSVIPARIAEITGRPPGHLGLALPELADHGPDWTAWRHQPQPLCPRCDARHDGGPVSRLLPHHHYVCIRHQYWTGPPDAGQLATPLGPDLTDIIGAQRRHLRLERRHGTAAAYDAVLTGFLICGHLWDHAPRGWDTPWHRWHRRAQALIPAGQEAAAFSASRIFAATYPEAITLATIIASPRWRGLAAGDPAQRQQVTAEVGRLLGRPDYQPPDTGDAIAHWIEYDSWQPPSQPAATYPQTRDHGTPRPAAVSQQTLQRQGRSTAYFALNRRGGNVILHHRRIRPVLTRDWSPAMDGITATIWASQATGHPAKWTPVRTARTAPASPPDSRTTENDEMN
jgi:hypothetical protein